MKPSLSVCVMARDEEFELARCPDSLPKAQEVIVVIDSRSRDGTEKLARERADRVELHRYEGMREQMGYCASLAKHEWVMMIDPDEVMPGAADPATRYSPGYGRRVSQRFGVQSSDMAWAPKHWFGAILAPRSARTRRKENAAGAFGFIAA